MKSQLKFERSKICVDVLTYSNSAFGFNETGDAVFINSRIVEKMDLAEGMVVYGVCIENFDDKKRDVPWRAVRVDLINH